jgi:hypothetical protein
VRNTLVAALASCADHPRRPEAHEFLTGLSSDELQFIAEFLGACILDSIQCCRTRQQLAERIGEFQRGRHAAASRDQDHKTILLLEYLSRVGANPAPALSC